MFLVSTFDHTALFNFLILLQCWYFKDGFISVFISYFFTFNTFDLKRCCIHAFKTIPGFSKPSLVCRRKRSCFLDEQGCRQVYEFFPRAIMKLYYVIVSFITIVRQFSEIIMYSLETISTLWHKVQLHENDFH